MGRALHWAGQGSGMLSWAEVSPPRTASARLQGCVSVPQTKLRPLYLLNRPFVCSTDPSTAQHSPLWAAHRGVVGDELLVGEEPGVGLLVGPLQEGDHLQWKRAGEQMVGKGWAWCSRRPKTSGTRPRTLSHSRGQPLQTNRVCASLMQAGPRRTPSDAG